MRTDLVWTCPSREGRTQDGNDATHKGVLKMLHPCPKPGPDQFLLILKRSKVVPYFNFLYEIASHRCIENA